MELNRLKEATAIRILPDGKQVFPYCLQSDFSYDPSISSISCYREAEAFPFAAPNTHKSPHQPIQSPMPLFDTNRSCFVRHGKVGFKNRLVFEGMGYAHEPKNGVIEVQEIIACFQACFVEAGYEFDVDSQPIKTTTK